MKLSKQDALILYGALFNFLKSEPSSLSGFTAVRSTELLEELSEFILNSSTSHSQDDEDDSEESSENQKEEPESEETTTPDVLSGLPTVTVVSPTGSKVDLEFEDVGDDSSVDVLLDEGSMIIDSVTHLKLTQKTIELYDGAEWHVFEYKKPPKTWSKALKVDVVYGLGNPDDSDDGEEE